MDEGMEEEIERREKKRMEGERSIRADTHTTRKPYLDVSQIPTHRTMTIPQPKPATAALEPHTFHAPP
jgi:hypothetical protein